MPFTIVASIVCVGFVLLLTSKEFKKYSGKREERSSLVFDVGLLKIWGLLVLSMGTFIRMFAMQGAIATIFPLYAEGLGISLSITGIILSMRSAGMIAGSFLTSRVINRFGLRTVILVGLTLDATSIALYALGGAFEEFAFASNGDGGTEWAYCYKTLSSSALRRGILLHRPVWNRGGWRPLLPHPLQSKWK